MEKSQVAWSNQVGKTSLTANLPSFQPLIKPPVKKNVLPKIGQAWVCMHPNQRHVNSKAHFCGASAVSSDIIKIQEECIQGGKNSWIHHFLPDCIAFNLSALYHFLLECIVPWTTPGCQDIEPSSFFIWIPVRKNFIEVDMFFSDLPVKR